MSIPGGYPGGAQEVGFNRVGHLNGAGASLTQATPSNNPFKEFFGEPRGGESALRQQINPYQSFGRENLALPEYYKGHNVYLTTVFIQLITDEQMVPTRIVLPVRVTESEMTITWDEMHFNNALLGPVPEEGASRLVTQQVSERSDSYVRYGLAFLVEHGFFKTPRGQQTYAMNIRQIKNAILESLYIGVVEALLKCKTVSHMFTQMYGRAITVRSAENAMKKEVETFAQIQKGEFGWDMINSEAKKSGRLIGIEMDVCLVPEGMKKYIATKRENFAYFLKGPDGKSMYDGQLADKDPKQLDVNSDTLIFEVKQFEIPNRDDPVDVLSRAQSVGEYVVSFPHVDGMELESYVSSFRDIMVYDESRDGFKRITLAEGLDACARFTEDGVGSLIHDSRFDKNMKDMFVRDGQPVEYIGDMDADGMPDTAVRDWAKSVLGTLDNCGALTADFEALLDLVKDLETIDNSEMDSPAIKKWFLYVQDAYYSAKINTVRFDQVSKMLMIPTKEEDFKRGDGAAMSDTTKMFEDDGVAVFKPYGFGNPVGIAELTKDKYRKAFPELHDKAKRGYAALTKLFKRLENVCFDNVFLSPNFAPPFYHKRSGLQTFFANLVHVAQPCIFFNSERTEFSFLPYDVDGLTDDMIHPHIMPRFKKLLKDAKNVHSDLSPLVELLLCTTTASASTQAPLPDTFDPKNGENSDHLTVVRNAVQMIGQFFERQANIVVDEENKRNAIVTLIAALGAFLFHPDASKRIKYYTVFELLNNYFFIDFQNEDDILTAVRRVYLLKELTVKLSATTGEDIIKSDFNDVTKAVLQDVEIEVKDDTRTDVRLEITQLTASKDIVQLIETFNTNDPAKIKPDIKDRFLVTQDEVTSDGAREMRVIASKMDAGLEDTTVAGRCMSLQLVSAMAGTGMRPEEANNGQSVRFNIQPPKITKNNVVMKTKPYEDRADYQRGAQFGETFESHPGFFITFSEGFKDRFRRENMNGDVVERATRQAFLGVPVNKAALRRFIQKDVVFPFNVIYMRPFMTYRMGTAIWCKGGAETGETLIGHTDFQLADNVVQKMHYGNLTMYHRSIVYRHQHVYHGQNIYCQGYVGGDDTEMFKEGRDFDNYRAGNSNFKSMFAMLAPYSNKEYPNPMDITGSLPATKISSNGGGAHGQFQDQYPTCEYYKTFWGFENGDYRSSTDPYYTSEASVYNTVCYQGHQALYNPHSRQLNLVIPNTGHWGKNVYAGCGKVRAGMQKMLENIQFENVYGGGGQEQTVKVI